MITLYDELHLAPIKEPQEVLDIGTGTGIWAIEFGPRHLHSSLSITNILQANRHPQAKVVGSDLSPIQPNK